jgi:ESF2/ABP1 family protein
LHLQRPLRFSFTSRTAKLLFPVNPANMPSDKVNNFLDAGDSDDDVGRGYDSDDDLEKGGRIAKRRRVDDEDDSEAEDLSDDDQDQDGDGAKIEEKGAEGQEGGEEDEEEPKSKGKGKAKVDASDDVMPGMTKPLTKKNLVATEAAVRKSGVVYVSRVPPYMTPAKLRSLLEPYGKINRLFLAPEDPAARSRRIRNGGNKKRSFTEGWVEFVKKKDAKKACELLNVGLWCPCLGRRKDC